MQANEIITEKSLVFRLVLSILSFSPKYSNTSTGLPIICLNGFTTNIKTISIPFQNFARIRKKRVTQPFFQSLLPKQMFTDRAGINIARSQQYLQKTHFYLPFRWEGDRLKPNRVESERIAIAG